MKRTNYFNELQNIVSKGDVFKDSVVETAMSDMNITMNDINKDELCGFISGIALNSLKSSDIIFATWLYVTDKFNKK